MGVAKVTVSLPEELVAQIDGLADERGESRSAIVREAALDYVTAQKLDAQDKRREAGARRAIEALEALRALPGRTGRTGSEILRQMRDSDDGGWDARAQ
ncbi:MAG: ribbon-helix-helix domain-containing protein [Coriobacteriia bacterium]|nr:ribbon-helix-helix domain-containing protein [Coriobacteriia bacterium]